MAKDQPLEACSNYQIVMPKEEDDKMVSFSTDSLPTDYSGFSSSSWVCEQYDFPIPYAAVLEHFPLMEIYPCEPYYSSLDIVPSVMQGYAYDALSVNSGNGFLFWNEMNDGFENQYKHLLLLENGDEQLSSREKWVRRCREDKGDCNFATLSRKTLSQYFYMPITQAAKELNVGLTLLKKRCRELGIRRWPHRKLMSLQTVIKNVQEMEKEEGEGSNEKLREAIEILERERKLMEEISSLKTKQRG